MKYFMIAKSCKYLCDQPAKPEKVVVKLLSVKNTAGSGSRTDLEHEFAHGFELFRGVVLSMKQRVVGHLPQLHHHIAQLTLCTEKAQGALTTRYQFL